MARNTNSSASGSSTGSVEIQAMTKLNQDRLDVGQIREGMAPAVRAMLGQLTLLQETDSTNAAVMRLPGESQHAHAVLAESQTGGRGRRQRTWHSPAGGNIYLSLGWWFRNSKWPLSTLPLVVGIAVCRALARAGLQGHGIKWPNDILADDKKLAGILVELQSAGSGPALAVIGIGLNVRMPNPGKSESTSVIDRPWTDLVSQSDIGDAGIDRNRVCSLLLEELLPALEHFETCGFDGFREDWQKLDLLEGRKIALEHNGQALTGVARGVDGGGGLILETKKAGTRIFHSGEVSIQRD
jgi:BirA family biotin operon repressor/biotin-[acetyl-CoA-carboxylase] ligase